MIPVVYSNEKHRKAGTNKFDVFGKDHIYRTYLIEDLNLKEGEHIVMVYTHKDGLKTVIFGQITFCDLEDEAVHFKEIKNFETKLSWSQILGERNHRKHYKKLSEIELAEMYKRLVENQVD